MTAGVVSAIAGDLRSAHEGRDRASSGRKAPPFSQCSRTAGFLGLAIDEVAFGIEVIGNGCVDGGELL